MGKLLILLHRKNCPSGFMPVDLFCLGCRRARRAAEVALFKTALSVPLIMLVKMFYLSPRTFAYGLLHSRLITVKSFVLIIPFKL